jgi:hypothetical protein
MTKIIDLRTAPTAAAAFENAWGIDPIANGKFWGAVRTMPNGTIRCERAWASKQAAQRAGYSIYA